MQRPREISRGLFSLWTFVRRPNKAPHCASGYGSRNTEMGRLPDKALQSLRARPVYGTARWMKRIFLCDHPEVFPGVTGHSPGAGRARKKVFWRGRGARGGGRTFCPQKGGLLLAVQRTLCAGRRAAAFCPAGIKKGGSIAAPPKDDTRSKITLRRLPT